MTDAEVREVMDDGRPFTLRLTDGRLLYVPSRDYMFLPPRTTVSYVALPAEENPSQTVAHRIPISMIVSAELIGRPHPKADS